MAASREVAGTRARGRPPRTEQQRAAQRLRLTEAAMDAIRDGGAELSIDDLAVAAGVSKPVLYDEFGGKIGIADAIAVLLAERLERKVLGELTNIDSLDFTAVIQLIVEALINLIADEPELYAFLVRSIRTSDRGFLDNALVRVIHDRALLLVKLLGPALEPDVVSVLTDGLFGFMFAAIESWMPVRRPPMREFIDTLAAIIREGLRTAVERAS
ncbi:MAG: TetR/AcrR family transcriptional regulator [Acidimicrobiales bacterium]